MARLENWPLRGKIVLILSTVVLAYGALDALIQRYVVYASFVRLEKHEAARDMRRVREAIQNEVNHLELRSSAWAGSSEALRFVGGEDPDPLHASLDAHALEREKLDLLVFCRSSGEVLWSRALADCEASPPQEVEFRDLPNESLSLAPPLLARLDPTQPQRPASGLLETEHGHLLVCARYMLGPQAGAAPRGLVVIGRLLTPAWQAALARQTGVEFTLQPLLESLEHESDRAALD